MNYRKILAIINMYRVIPFYCLCMSCKFKDKVEKDLKRWKMKHTNLRECSDLNSFSWLMMNTKEFRNVMFNRLHRNVIRYVIGRILFKPLESLYINMPPENIGGGFYLQHGFSSVIAANRIGENCSINQQVTIGYNGNFSPVIENNVTIAAGAIVVGNIHIESNAIIGAGSVVVHDVHENEIVAGVPAKVIKKMHCDF